MRRRPADILVLLLVVLTGLVSGCSWGSGDPARLEVFGPWQGRDADSFRRVLDAFADETGIDVRYTGSASFATAMRARVTEGDLPDLAVFPQIGLVNELVRDGAVLELPPDTRRDVIDSYAPAIAAFAESAPFDGVLVKVAVKSLVWYRPDVFAADAYAVPETWDELEALTRQIADSGTAPWCFGVDAGTATGWPATDWVEDIVLRFQGTEIYDSWALGDVAFTDQTIREAFETFEELVLEIGEPVAGRSGVLNTTPARAQDPGLLDPPACVLYRHPSFHRSDLPDDVELGPDRDMDVFVLPATGSEQPPLLIGGDVAAAMSDRSETWDLLAFLASDEAARIWVGEGDFVSPNGGIVTADYRNEFDARMAGLIETAEVIRFDASDLMVPDVGTDTFLQAMTLLIAGRDVEETTRVAQSGYGSNG